MKDSILDRAKVLYAFEEWHGKSPLEKDLFIWRYVLAGLDLTGLAPVEIRTLAEEGINLSTWGPAAGEADRYLRVDIRECDSRMLAHENLIYDLASYTAGAFERRDDLEIGDVLFATPDQAVVTFARANLVVLVRNATEQHFDVVDIGRQFDAVLTDKPAPTEPKDAPRFVRIDASDGDLRVGESIPLTLEADYPAGRSIWYKFFVPSGKVFVDQERQLVYRPASPGEQIVTAYAVSAGGAVSTKELTLTVV